MAWHARHLRCCAKPLALPVRPFTQFAAKVEKRKDWASVKTECKVRRRRDTAVTQAAGSGCMPQAVDGQRKQLRSAAGAGSLLQAACRRQLAAAQTPEAGEQQASKLQACRQQEGKQQALSYP